jgi:glycosyltransferase involved in cell wall biosynthesis
MSGMKICMTTLEFPPDTGGVGESVKRISRMLADLGHEVHVVVFHSKRRKEIDTGVTRKGFDTECQDGVFVHRYQTVVRGAASAVQEFMSDVYAELHRLHEQEQFDVFHAFYINETGFLTTLLAREAGKPVINSIRGADIHRNVFNPVSYSHIVWSLENSSWVTFVSRQLEHRAHVLVPSIRDRTSAFWNSIVPINFDAMATPEHVDAFNGMVIGTFGNFRDKKGVDHLVWACEEVADELDLSLLFVGDFVAKEKAFWDDFISNSRIADRIIVTGRLPREQALGYHNHIDIFAIPSLRDGCPNALMEAMLAGKAIVGSTADAIGEILSDDENALVVRPARKGDLVEALTRLAADPQLRERLGSAARAMAMQELSPQREQENWLKVYDQVVSSDAPRIAGVATTRR